MQKKWVELFEKVIGRKPSPEEFMAGKACGFDLKQIQSIAGNAPAEEVAPVEEPVVEPVEEVKNVNPLLAARQAWLQHFEETYGRKPSAEEFTAAKSQNFEFFVGPVLEAEFANPDATEVTQEYVPQQPTQLIRLHLLLSKRRSLLVQMSQKQVQLRKNKRPLKRRGERNFPRRKLGLFLLSQSL